MSKSSKLLSLVLRHKPELIGLTLKDGGWVSVKELLAGLKKAGHKIGHDELVAIVKDNNKQRFSLSDDGRMIRAAQGHSVAVNLGLTSQEPPEELFHGTATSNLQSIWSGGIMPGKRQHVHLSTDKETATRVGQRHGKAVVLTVSAKKMYKDGHEFWKADNGVWLTDEVSTAYLGF